MAYTPTVFTDGAPPAITASELNKIGDGIEAAHVLAEGASDTAIGVLIADPDSDTYAAIVALLVDQIEDTGSATYAALSSLIDARVGLFIVQWDAGWGTYSTDTLQVRIFLSQHDEDATAPTYYNVRDLWFKYPTPAV